MRKNLSQKLIEKKLKQKVILTLLAKNEGDIIEETIKFHLNHGFDFIIATDNNSTDNTREILLKYQNLGKLELIDEVEDDFNQVKWVDRMIKIAINKYKADWVVNVDADEFWFSRYGNIKLSLPDPKKFNVVYLNAVHIAPPSLENNSPQNSLIRPNMKGHLAIKWKCLHTAKGYKKIGGGNHTVSMKFGYNKTASSLDITIYHFWVRSLEHYEKKIVNTFHTLEKGVKNGVINLGFGQHIRDHYKLYQEGKLTKLYSQMSESSNSNFLIDNSLYDYIKNDYNSTIKKMVLEHNCFNAKIESPQKTILKKLIISCKKRINEIKILLNKSSK